MYVFLLDGIKVMFAQSVTVYIYSVEICIILTCGMVTRDCLRWMGKMPVESVRFTMVVIIGRIVAETSFRRKVGMSSRSHCFLGDACKGLTISSIDGGGNDDKT